MGFGHVWRAAETISAMTSMLGPQYDLLRSYVPSRNCLRKALSFQSTHVWSRPPL